MLAGDADAERLAAELDDQNTERQRVQELVWKEALAQASAQVAEMDAPALVVGAEGWHAGVVGIIAARLVDRFARPAIAIGFRDGEGRGSARTVAGVNLFDALARCASHLTKFGGHAGAAGMSIAIGELDGVPRRLRRRGGAPARRGPAVGGAGGRRGGDPGRSRPAASPRSWRGWSRSASPTGEPLFALSGVTTMATRVVGKDHLQLTLDHGGATSEAIAFGFADADPGAGARVDLVATAELDTFRGLTRTRLKVSKLARALA